MKLHVHCRWHCGTTGNLLFPSPSTLLVHVQRPGKVIPWHNPEQEERHLINACAHAGLHGDVPG